MCFGGGSSHHTQGPTSYEIEMMDQAEKRMKEYQDTFVPLEGEWMKRNKLYGSDAFLTKKQNEAVVGAKMTNSGAAVAGVNMQPGARFLMNAQGTADASGAGAGLATAAGRQVALNKEIGSGLDVVKLGRNQTATSANLNSTLASTAAGVQAAQYQAAQRERDATYGAMGTAVGMAGMAAYDKWGSKEGKPTAESTPTG